MSETADPTADTVEVENSEEQVKEQLVQVQQEEPEREAQEEEQPAKVESMSDEVDNDRVRDVDKQEKEEKEEEESSELEPSEVEQVDEQEPELERRQEVGELEQEEEEEKVEEEEEDEEKSPEESQDPMQLPSINMSQGAIEDEEMPSMVNISSPSRIDESETNNGQDDSKKFIDIEGKSSPDPKPNYKKEDDNSDDSVCIVDDDDDEEEEEGESSYDEESSSYHDDDDSDERDRERDRERERERDRNYEDFARRRARRVDDEDDEDEDEEEDCEVEGEDMDDDSEPDGFDGGSDDVVLRYSNGLIRPQKERSASLQDLSLMKGSSPNRQNVNPFSQKARFERNQYNAEHRGPGKQYAHVESKVKKYIMDMTEQRRISGERRKQKQEEERLHNNKDNPEIEIRRTDEIVTICKSMKDYSEKTLKNVAEYDEEEEHMSTHEDMYIVPQLIQNNEISIFPRRSMGNGEPIKEQEMDVDPIEVELHKSDEKYDKINGTGLNERQNNYRPERKGLRREEYTPKPVLNGEDPSNSVCNLRTLTYEEYMKGATNKEINEEVINDESVIEELQNVPEKCNNNETEPAYTLRIENVMSNYNNAEKVDDSIHGRKTPVMIKTQSTETQFQENFEIQSLKAQLSQRNAQFDNLRDAYQKTVSENLAMKMELENLKKMLAHYQEQPKPVTETKMIAVQTEAQGRSMPLIEVNDVEQQTDNRLATTTTSVISSQCSQWSDSIGSTAISMEPPPSVTNALNSDESSNQTAKTPLKPKNAFSRAFITSSRILQTLSNITHGKSKTDKHGNKISKSRVPESVAESSASDQDAKSQSTEAGPSNSKKRKATDTLDISGGAQPFKIPHMSKPHGENDRILSTPVPQFVNPNDENNFNKSSATVEEKEDDNDVHELDDDVKVFVYPEDETGKEHSFLIQAKEITSSSKAGVRECGPYLLGNVEVYMTEMNGTINIWGKELSQDTTSQNTEELETSTKSKEIKPGFRWQSTPRIFNNHISASTGKHSRVQPRFTQQHHLHKRHSCDINNTIVDCENYSPHSHRLSWPSCNQCAHESQHTCPPNIRIDGMHHGCGHKDDRQGSGFATCCKSQQFIDNRRFSLPNVCQDSHSSCCCSHNHYRSPAQEESNRHQTFIRRHSFNPTDEEEDGSDIEEIPQNTTQSYHSPKENSPHSCSNSKLVPPSSVNKRSSCSGSPSCQNESDPLISQKLVSEVSEARKKRLGGKRVRGILLDLLKGCGDCRTSNPINKTNLRHEASIYQPSTSSQKTACPSNQPSCSFRANEKCTMCSKTAEIESQLEFFRIEMDKLRSCSDTLREMLDALQIHPNRNE